MKQRHGRINVRGENPPRSTFYDQGKFGRLFPWLPPFARESDAEAGVLRSRLMEIGEKGGIMDAKDVGSPADQLAPKPINNPDNETMTAGFTFLGQFLDHDITFDPSSSLQRQEDPEAIRNFRTPAFELDSVYGSGPNAAPHLYDQTAAGAAKFYIEPIEAPASKGNAPKFDLPRNRQGVALIGDPRNDENLMVSQLHLAFLKFHNAVVEREKVSFEEAQRLVRWHYQWVIVNEFLPKTVGRALVRDLLDNPKERFYDWRHQPFIPVEFSVACYRFGHSQVRPSYRANFGPTDGAPFIATIFDATLPTSTDPGADPDDLRGGKRASRRFIDWQTFWLQGREQPSEQED